ncbi:hypothetical protein [Hymenobacter rubidus]|uniref:hypothetical protein n=1 Tax=Hymenobacter rubidus TaxID=1441626 RepID=UPI00191DFA7A|nr:hypothetical protein [Hymenobacter rubidus]
MRFCLLLLCLPVLLASCSKTATPVRLDFIGTSSLTSGNKTVGPNDTLSTRVYAVGADKPLKRLRITVTYDPGLTPITYPLPLSSFDPTKNAPAAQELIYLDSLIAPLPQDPSGREYLFVNQFGARATSGTEQWQYTATDTQGATASRAYRLTARKPDSAAVYHSYTALLRPVPVNPIGKTRARVFLNLHYGLLLPKYALVNQEASLLANQNLVDLICLTNSTGTALRLSAPADTQAIKPNSVNWPSRRSTQLRRTNLTSDQFSAAVTTAAFETAFNAGAAFTANPLSTGTLTKDQVIAFKTADGLTGLLRVSDVVLGSAPVLTCLIRVQK